MNVLCINSGSSSLKFALFGEAEQRLAEGAMERIGQQGGRLIIKGKTEEARDFPGLGAAIDAMFDAISKAGLPQPSSAGHRVVHGGPKHFAPERVTPELLQSLRELIPLAPLHLPGSIKAIEAMQSRSPDLPQAVCFDTAFHERMPEVAKRLPIPRKYGEEGVRKYGFHGLSYEYIVSRLGLGAGGRTIIAHLGNGASMAAVLNGEPVDTTMGMTPAGGLVMGTRTGDLDPGVAIYLQRTEHWNADQLEELVDRKSGLLGISGTASDMKTLLEKRGSDRAVAEAVESFCYSARKHIGALVAVLGGLDTLVFTGGIGERAAPVREEICRGLEYLGVHIDAAANARHAEKISSGACSVRVIPTDEDLVIARHVRSLFG